MNSSCDVPVGRSADHYQKYLENKWKAEREANWIAEREAKWIAESEAIWKAECEDDRENESKDVNEDEREAERTRWVNTWVAGLLNGAYQTEYDRWIYASLVTEYEVWINAAPVHEDWVNDQSILRVTTMCEDLLNAVIEAREKGDIDAQISSQNALRDAFFENRTA